MDPLVSLAFRQADVTSPDTATDAELAKACANMCTYLKDASLMNEQLQRNACPPCASSAPPRDSTAPAGTARGSPT